MIEELQSYLKDPAKPYEVTVSYRGEKRRLFYNDRIGLFGLKLKGARRNGYIFGDWNGIEKVYYPKEESKEEYNYRIAKKYYKCARKATFTNEFIRKCLTVDVTKSPYQNGISTGVPIEGRIITLFSIEKQYPTEVECFRQALAARRKYHGCRLPFRGYEMTLELCHDNDEPDNVVRGFLSLEYKDCANGRYYLLVNDNEFIGYDID